MLAGLAIVLFIVLIYWLGNFYSDFEIYVALILGAAVLAGWIQLG